MRMAINHCMSEKEGILIFSICVELFEREGKVITIVMDKVH